MYSKYSHGILFYFSLFHSMPPAPTNFYYRQNRKFLFYSSYTSALKNVEIIYLGIARTDTKPPSRNPKLKYQRGRLLLRVLHFTSAESNELHQLNTNKRSLTHTHGPQAYIFLRFISTLFSYLSFSLFYYFQFIMNSYM